MAAMPRMLPSHATVDRRGFVVAIAGLIFGRLYFVEAATKLRIREVAPVSASITGRRMTITC